MSNIIFKAASASILGLVAFLSFLMPSENAKAENFCAHAKPNSVEVKICGDLNLLPLDKTLNSAYALARKSVADPTALQQEQLKWLREVRDRCDSIDCLTLAYRRRIAELGDQFVSAAQVSEAPLSNDEARATCRELAALADNDRLTPLMIPGVRPPSDDEKSGTLSWSFTENERAKLESLQTGFLGQPNLIYKLRLQNAVKPERFGQFWGHGTCASAEIFHISHLLDTVDAGIDRVPDPDEQIRWATWGGAEYPVFYRGRNFIVAAYLPNSNRLSMISWIKPDGNKRPICLLSPELNGKLKNEPATQPDVCSKIINGKLKPLNWKNINSALPIKPDSPTYRDDFRSLYEEYAEGVESLTIDIDGDGKPETVGRFTYDSGAGCGSRDTWLSILSKDLGRIEKGPLSTLIGGRRYGPVELYVHKGKTFISIASRDADGTIFQIQNKKLKPICELKQVTRTYPTQFFSVDSQPASSTAE